MLQNYIDNMKRKRKQAIERAVHKGRPLCACLLVQLGQLGLTLGVGLR